MQETTPALTEAPTQQTRIIAADDEMFILTALSRFFAKKADFTGILVDDSEANIPPNHQDKIKRIAPEGNEALPKAIAKLILETRADLCLLDSNLHKVQGHEIIEALLKAVSESENASGSQEQTLPLLFIMTGGNVSAESTVAYQEWEKNGILAGILAKPLNRNRLNLLIKLAQARAQSNATPIPIGLLDELAAAHSEDTKQIR